MPKGMGSEVKKVWLENNRGLMVGFVADPAAEVRYEKYLSAWRRVLKRLELKARPKDPGAVRGKRRALPPAKASHTIRQYTKVFETFLYWLRATRGNIEPRQVTHADALAWIEWLSNPILPDIRDDQIAEAGDDLFRAWKALQVQCKESGTANVVEVWRGMNRSNRGLGAQPLPDELKLVERLLLRLQFDYKSVSRSPTSRELRERGKDLKYKLPIEQYRYQSIDRKPLNPSSIRIYLIIMGVFWNEMMRGENYPGGEAPIQYNIWREHIQYWASAAKEMTARRKLSRRFDDAVVIAVERVAQVKSGEVVIDGQDQPEGIGSIESVRDLAVVYALEYLGLRAEELAGALRKDVVESADGSILINIYGKGDKLRQLPFDGPVRDTYYSLSALLRQEASGEGEDAEWAAQLLEDDAPLWPAVPRWGKNCPLGEAEGAERPPRELCNPKEPLAPRGVALILERLCQHAMVAENGVVRPLSEEERKQVHPHNYRRYLATKLSEAGLSTEDIKNILGHASTVTTEEYILRRAPIINVTAAMLAARRGVSYSKQGDLEAAKAREKTGLEPAEPSFQPLEPFAAGPEREERVLGEELEPSDSPEMFQIVKKLSKGRGSLGGHPETPPPAEVAEAQVVELGRRKGAPSPMWAYNEKGVEKYSQYAPPPKSVPDMNIAIRFMRGDLSLLPWWTGMVGNWTIGDGATPVPSFRQITDKLPAGQQLSRELLGLRNSWLRDPSRGFTAASNLVAWISLICGQVAHTLYDVVEIKNGEFVLWDEWAQNEPGVREHQLSAIMKWFETYGFEMTKQGSENTPVLANQANHKPPAWFMEDDPLLSMPIEERKQMRKWLAELQGLDHPAATKVSEGIALVAQQISEFDRIKRAESSFKASRGGHMTDEQIRWCFEVMFKNRRFLHITDEETWRDWSKNGEKKITDMCEGLFGVRITKDEILKADSEKLPEDKIEIPDDDKIEEQLEYGVSDDDDDEPEDEEGSGEEVDKEKKKTKRQKDEELEAGRKGNLHKKIVMALKRKGIEAVEDVRRKPAIRGVLADPKYLTFTSRHTIVHSEEVKNEFFRKYAKDSECVIRRAVRWVWECHRQKASISTSSMAKSMDLALTMIIPCPAAIEEALVKRAASTGYGDADALATKWADVVASLAGEEGLRATDELVVKQMMAELRDAGEEAVARAKPGAGKLSANADALFPDPIELIFKLSDPL